MLQAGIISGSEALQTRHGLKMTMPAPAPVQTSSALLLMSQMHWLALLQLHWVLVAVLWPLQGVKMKIERQTAARCAQLGVQQVYIVHLPVTGVLEYMAG